MITEEDRKTARKYSGHRDAMTAIREIATNDDEFRELVREDLKRLDDEYSMWRSSIHDDMVRGGLL